MNWVTRCQTSSTFFEMSSGWMAVLHPVRAEWTPTALSCSRRTSGLMGRH